MAKGIEKPERLHDQDLDLTGPLLPSVEVENERERRDKSVARLRLLWSQRVSLGRAAAVGLVAGALIAFLIPNRYTSTTQLMPPDEQGSNGMSLLAGLAGKSGSTLGLGALGSQLLGLKTTGDLFIGILQSRTVQDDLIQKFDLRELYGDRSWEDARKKLEKRTGLSSDHKNGIISISVEDTSPHRAQQMAEEYVAELNRVVVNSNTSSAHRERVFLEGRLAQVQQNLESAEKVFSQFASKNTTIDIEEQGKAMIEAGASLEGQLIAAQTELEGLKQVFANSNVRVREMQARVDELRLQLQEMAGKGSSAGDPSETDSSALYPPIRQLPLLGVSYADLYRKMKVEEAIFGTLTQEYELAKVEEAKETPSVNVLDPPNMPEKKSFPSRFLIIFLSTVVTGAIAGVWVLANQRWEAVEPRDPRKLLAAEVWSDVRRALPWHSRKSARRERRESPAELDGRGATPRHEQ